MFPSVILLSIVAVGSVEFVHHASLRQRRPMRPGPRPKAPEVLAPIGPTQTELHTCGQPVGQMRQAADLDKVETFDSAAAERGTANLGHGSARRPWQNIALLALLLLAIGLYIYVAFAGVTHEMRPPAEAHQYIFGASLVTAFAVVYLILYIKTKKEYKDRRLRMLATFLTASVVAAQLFVSSQRLTVPLYDIAIGFLPFGLSLVFGLRD